MFTGIVILAFATGLLVFCIFNATGSAVAARVRIWLSWLWLTRISTLALIILLLLPWPFFGFARSLVIGVYDLHGSDLWGLTGTFFSGLLFAFLIWTVFVTAALTLGYGEKRTRCVDKSPEWFPTVVKGLLWISLGLNSYTILAATDPEDRVPVAKLYFGGLLVGFVLIWLIEEVHQRINDYPMSKYHLLHFRKRADPPPLDNAQVASKTLTNPFLIRLKEMGQFLNNLKLSSRNIEKWRGYVDIEADQDPAKPPRVYLLPGHGLAVFATVVWLIIYLLINFCINPASQLTALVYLLVLLITWNWILAGATFYFDAHRIPVLLPIVAWVLAASCFDQADHFYRIWPATQTIADAHDAGENARVPETELKESPLGPAEVIVQGRSKNRPIILVAAAGGGIQSAAWTAKVLTGLEQLASAEKLVGSGGFARSVQALSGVSGGSTGIMFFVQAYGPAGFAGPRTDEPPRASDANLLRAISDAARATSLGQSTWGLAYPDLRRANFPFLILNSFSDRAEAMEKAWAYNARHISGIALGDASLREWQADTRAGRRPAVIFNSTIVETGERLSFSTAPSPQLREGRCEFSTPEITGQKALAAGQFLYPGADIRITTAVRLSATFPFVSPNARPGVAKSRYDSNRIDPSSDNPLTAGMVPGATGKLHVADGGYYENSSLSDLAEWLDRGLTQLAGEPSTLPKEVLVISIDGFPEGEAKSVSSRLRFLQRGSIFQMLAPILTLGSVRGSGHTAFANHGFALLQHRWLIDQKTPVTIRHVRFVLPTISAAAKAATKGGKFWPSWAEAQPDRPPLSWHLRGPEQQAIDDAWEKLVSEQNQNFANLLPEEQEKEWSSRTSRPIDKVLYFLSATELDATGSEHRTKY